MQPITSFSGRLVPLLMENVDTDQIIPARFLKTTEKTGLGENLFHDWRYDGAGNPKPEFVLNQPRSNGAAMLLAGDNFGCGSSREHAPWALLGFGFRAVISTSFADIFRGNCLKNGLLPIEVDRAVHARLRSLVEEDPAAEFGIDLASRCLRLPTGDEVEFPIDEFARHCLLGGVDQLGYLLQKEPEIRTYEQAHDPRVEIQAGE